MGFWNIVIPSDTDITNLVTNPSLELASTGYAGITATVTATPNYARRGYRSLSVLPTTSVNDGAYFDGVTLQNGFQYTFSFDILGEDGTPYVGYFADTSGTVVSGAIVGFNGNGNWQRQDVQYSSTADGNFRVYVTKNTSESQAAYYVDGVGVYKTAYDPGYIDGDQEDCVWNGGAHASTSKRLAGSRAGGQLVNFDAYNFFVNSSPGAGDPDIQPLTLSLALLPGSVDQGEKIAERVFTLVGTIIGASQTDLHASRKSLLDALKSDRVKDKQQFWLVYTGSNSSRPVRIRCKYIGGMSYSDLSGFSENLALKFLATDPYWYEDGNDSAALTHYGYDTDPKIGMKSVDAVWSPIDTAYTGAMYDMKIGKDGAVYIAGLFDKLTTTDTEGLLRADSVDSTAFSTVGTGPNSYVNALAVAFNGDIILGGNFTDAGGVANTTYIARWDGSAYNAVAVGLNSIVYDLAYGKDGGLYIGGNFTDAGGVAGADYIARWGPVFYTALGTGGDAAVKCVTIDAYGNVYAGGDFTVMGGVAGTNHLARWNGSAWESLGSDLASTDVISSMCSDSVGNVYVAGLFATIGGVTVNNIAMYDGSSWTALGGGCDVSVSKVRIGDDGFLYASGGFTTIGGISATYAAMWNGSVWTNIPISYTGTGLVARVYPHGRGLFVNLNENDVRYSVKTSVTNSGTARVYPRITISRSSGNSARIYYIKNETTGDTIWLNYAINDGESLTIDFGLSKRSVVSSYFGNVMGDAILRNSDFADFHLIPGVNEISVFVSQSSTQTITTYITWPITHLSLDGSST